MNSSESVFLSAQWRHLGLVTWQVPEQLLLPYLPKGLELDRLPDDPAGVGYVSYVAFRFLHTRVRGIAIPHHVHFPEVNLRFYVRHGTQRGVCFVREYVPKTAIAWVARLLYNEPYRAVPMRMQHTDLPGDGVCAKYGLKKGGRWHTLTLEAQGAPIMPASDSIAHFFKEHEWGYGHTRSGRLLSYRVWHPHWHIWPTPTYRLDADFGLLYGDKWALLNEVQPISILFAEGSEIQVFSPS